MVECEIFAGVSAAAFAWRTCASALAISALETTDCARPTLFVQGELKFFFGVFDEALDMTRL